MSLTKPQKKFILNNAKYLTIFELSDRVGVDQSEIVSYLKNNGLKPITEKNLADVSVEKIEKIKNKTMLSVFDIFRKNLSIIIGLIFFTVLIYANSLNGDFVSDDYATITQNPDVKKWGPAIPIGIAALHKVLIANLFGVASPVPYHAANLVLYILVCLLSFVFLYNIFGKYVSLLTTILFISLPIHVEAVSWISGEPYLYLALFILMFLINFSLYLDNKKKKYIWFSIISLVLLFLVDRFRGTSAFFLGYLYMMAYKEKIGIKVNLIAVAFVAIIGVGIMLAFSMPLIQSRVGSVNSGYNSTESIFYKPLEQYPTSIAKYLQLMFVPTDLTLYHTMYVIPVWLNWFIFLIYIASLVYFYFKNRDVFFALGFIFLAAAASMSPVKVSWLVAERYLFLGSLGFCLFLILLFKKIAQKNMAIYLSLFSLLVIAYSVRTMFRNHDWRTNHLLWVATVQVSPNSHNAWNNIGDDYDKLASAATNEKEKLFYTENAIKGFSQSTIVKPNYADAYHNRANIFFKAGRLDLARDSYVSALYYSPGLYQSYISLAQLELQLGDMQAAIKWTNKLLEVAPNDPQAYYVAGMVSAQAGDLVTAKLMFQKVLMIMPNNDMARQTLNQIETLLKQQQK